MPFTTTVNNSTLREEGPQEIRTGPDDYKKFFSLVPNYRKTFKGQSHIFSTFITPLFVPADTRTVKSFTFDLFLPTTTRWAIPTKNITLRVIATILAAILDIATLPIRIVTAIPTVIHDKILRWRLKKLLIKIGFDAIYFKNNGWVVKGDVPLKSLT